MKSQWKEVKMNKKILMALRNVSIVIGLALLSSCAASGAKFSGIAKPSDHSAQVYIYRPSAFVQSGNFPDLALDGAKIGQLKNGGFLSFQAPAGEHSLSITGNALQWIHRDRNVPLKLEAGKTYFFKLTVSVSGSGGINVGFGQHHSFGFQQITDEEKALAELSELKESI